MSNCNNLIGVIKLAPYFANYPISSKLFPNGKNKIKSFLYIFKQKDNNIWGKNYWKFIDEKEYNIENFTGVLDNNVLRLVEDSLSLDSGSSGEFILKKIKTNQWKVKYLGIGKGITFETLGKFKTNYSNNGHKQ
jgi:hypothetical protein